MNDSERNGTAVRGGIDDPGGQETPVSVPAGCDDSPELIRFSLASTDHAGWRNQVEAPSDFPAPRALTEPQLLIWDADAPPVENYVALGIALAASGDLFRMPAHAAGLLLASSNPNVPPTPIQKGSQLAPVIADRLRLLVVKDGKPKGGRLPATELTTLLGSELFLQQFMPVDRVVRTPMFVGADFLLTSTGYNDAGRGQRVIYTGEPARIEHGLDAITRFVDVMAFASNADRTNAVAAALSVMLRNYWPGGKPLVLLTSSKSHGGKETVIEFARGNTRKVSISYERTDWPLQKAFVAVVNQDAEIAVVNIENVRLEGQHQIGSAFLERFLTDPEPELYAPGTGAPRRRVNDLIVTMSTNFGAINEDLGNRALPIHLDPIGDIDERQSPIGNPKMEYLPKNRDRIEAELRGMIARWVEEGRPLDHQVRHPFVNWARTIGGILMVSGFRDFLQNYSYRRSTDDPVRRALGLLGAAMPDQWASAAKWASLVAHLGLTKTLIPPADRESAEGRARGIGVVLSVHRDETLKAETDDELLTLRLEKARRRFVAGRPETRYRFLVIDRTALPVDSSSTS